MPHKLILTLGLALLLASCQTSKPLEHSLPPISSPEPITELPELPSLIPVLSWVITAPAASKAARALWSATLMNEVSSNFSSLDMASDVRPFCPTYYYLSLDLKKQFWAELFIGMAYKESGYNPASVYKESFGVDSIGLYQLSYEDQWSYCDMNKAKGTLKDPIKNIECAIRGASRFITRDKVLALGTSSKTAKGLARYWSVMRSNSSAYSYIKHKTNSLSYCNNF